MPVEVRPGSQYFDPPVDISPDQMRLRDIVRMTINANRPWGNCIVKKITEQEVYLYRPYAISGDCQYSGPSVICYMGLEEYRITRQHLVGVWQLMERPEPPQ